MTNFDDDDEVVVGQRLPRLASVAPLDGLNVVVTWDGGARPEVREIVDLAPAIHRYTVYAPLRDDPDLFRTVHLQEHRFGIAWGRDGDVDMGASTVADLADETMTAKDFSAFMERNDFTLDGVAAELGLSRRMAAYYRKERKVPRTVALACRYIDLKAQGGALASANVHEPATLSAAAAQRDDRSASAAESTGTASAAYGNDPFSGNDPTSRRTLLERLSAFGSEVVEHSPHSADDPSPLVRRSRDKAS